MGRLKHKGDKSDKYQEEPVREITVNKYFMMFSNALYLFSYKKGLFTPKTVSEILDLSSKTDLRSLRLFMKRKTCYIAE